MLNTILLFRTAMDKATDHATNCQRSKSVRQLLKDENNLFYIIYKKHPEINTNYFSFVTL